MTTFRDLVPTKLAAGIWNCLVKYKSKIKDFPQTETCELLILDRSVDQVFIYDSLCTMGMAYIYLFGSKTIVIMYRLPLLYMNGRMMQCVMTCLTWREINMCMR